jgi:ATP-dependent Clp protease ATP-binding subunit ClpC
MYERFTDRARKVVQLAQQSAIQTGCTYVGPEHLFLGLLDEGKGVGVHAVMRLIGKDLSPLRHQLTQLTRPEPKPTKRVEPRQGGKRLSLFQRFLSLFSPEDPRLLQTVELRQVINDAIVEARQLNHNYIGTEHLLLGLMHDQAIVTALASLGLDLARVRQAVNDLLDNYPACFSN